MRLPGLSIRTAVLGTLGILNILLAGIAVTNTVRSIETMHRAEIYGTTSTTLNTLFTYANELSLARGTSVAAVYSDAAHFAADVKEARQLNQAAKSTFKSIVSALGGEEKTTDLLSVHYQAQERLDAALDALYAAKTAPRNSKLADETLEAYNRLIDNTDSLGLALGGDILADTPDGARRLRFAHAVWTLSEFAGRQYALLARLIAEEKYPDEQQERTLLVWQGKIEYAWDLSYGFLKTNSWGSTQKPFLDEAKTQFDITFEQVKSIFVSPHNSTSAAAYPITPQLWLGLAAQTGDTLQKLTENAVNLNRTFISDLRRNAMQEIVINLLLLLGVLCLSVYSWKVVEQRVLLPVRLMIENMYRAARGDHYELPSEAYGRDEIGKLAETLKIFSANSQQLEAERDRANTANQAKSEFLASMSHEIRTPLNVVLGVTAILQSEKQLSDNQKKLLDMQQRNAEMLLALLNDLLDITKIESQNFELEKIPFDLAEAINDTVAQLSGKAREKELLLKADTSAVRDMQFLGDPTRIKQILTNLCSNAIKFTQAGTISVTVHRAPSPEPGVSRIQIDIADTGIGIPRDKIDKIFEKFTQVDSSVSRRYGGSGLGLSISKAFVEMMGGTISVKSEPGKGSTFSIQLPMQTAGSLALKGHMRGSPDIPADDKSKKRILVVEDYAPNAIVAGTFLEQLGYQHEVAEDGQQAIQMVFGGSFDAVLMDIQMPGMDGFTVTEEIRRREAQLRKPRVRIIGLTAHATLEDRSRCFAVGMDDFLAKPFTSRELGQKLKELVDDVG